MNYGEATEAKISEVLEACKRYGDRSIVALAGVPGTGKSFIASIAAQRHTGEPLLVREVQFHQSFSYEEFIEGLRINNTSGIEVIPGVFLEWNQMALDDPDHRYVFLIEELTRANISAVLGELMTYIEHRDKKFTAMYSRKPVVVAKNLTILATFNPTDRSAIELDTALLRRIRIIRCPPDTNQLAEMLRGKNLHDQVINKLKNLFFSCQREHRDYDYIMPFGHGIFADINDEQPDLYRLWIERIQYMLWRPLIEPHPFTETISECYPWKDPDYRVS
ncbi:MAG: AAA family ATPase [Candidatus Methanomethyliaceae archaeon]